MLTKEILSRKFIYMKKDTNYGYCNKFNQNITFYPNICSLDTQECFLHRKD